MEHPDITKMNRCGTLYPYYDDEEGEVVGKCEHCGEDVYDSQARYNIEGVLLHEDCLYGWARKYEVA